jgi:hypothetical protein
MACAPHLSFLVVVFSFMILCMAFPSIGFRLGSVFCVGCCISWGVLWGAGWCVWGNSICACCSAALMVLGEFLYVMRNSYGVRVDVLFVFMICDSVVMPYVYSLSRYFWDCILEWSERVWYMGLVLHVISNGVFLIGKVLFVVVTCISYSFLSKKSVRDIGDLEHACCFSLGRWREPLYLAVMYLVRPR